MAGWEAVEEDLYIGTPRRAFIGYQHDLFMPIKEPLEANSRKTIREMRNNLYTERGRPVKIHRFLTRVLELFLGNLDNLEKYS